MRFLFIIFVLPLIFAAACTKKNNDHSKVKIQLDPSIFSGSSGKLSKVSGLSNDGPDWGLSDPTNLSQINCWGVFVGGPESFLKGSHCTNYNDQVLMRFGQRAGFYPISDTGVVEVPAGEDRIIYLAAMASSDGSCDPGFDSNPDINFPNYSHPFVIGQVVVNLLEPEVEVPIVVQNQFSDSNKIKDCDFLPIDDGIATPQELSFTDSSPYDFGNVVALGNSSHTLTLLNNTSHEASGLTLNSALSTPFGFPGGFPGAGGDCSSVLASGESCTIVVDYSPTDTSFTANSFTIDYTLNGVLSSLPMDLRGQGITSASLSISETNPFDYGSITTGASTNHTFTVSNSGQVAATGLSETGLAAPFNFAGGSFPGTGGTCGPTINPLSNCTIVVEYSPGTTGLQADTIVLNYNDGVAAQSASRDIQGTGLSPALLIITGANPFDFGSHTNPSTSVQTLVIMNSGGSTATGMTDAFTLSSPFQFTGGSYPGFAGGGPCGPALGPGSTCNIEVEYSPGVSAGLEVSNIGINYNDGASLQMLSHPVQGTGL